MKVYIWGIGRNTKIFNEFGGVKADIIGYIDSYTTTAVYNERPVYKLEKVDEYYDAIVVPSMYTEDIYAIAKKNKINSNRLIFIEYCNSWKEEGLQNLEMIKSILSDINYQRFLASYNLINKSFYVDDKEKYKELNKRKEFEINDENEWPIIKEKYTVMGNVGVYFWQDLWAARRINDKKPQTHYDIGSRLDGFLAHILSMGIDLKVIDIRPFPIDIPGMDTIVSDATTLDFIADDSIESLSALCSLEHFGLGRYGDEIDPEACFKCFGAIQNKVISGGYIYISVPVGKDMVQFNAHRIFRAQTIIDNFDRCELIEYSYCDSKHIEENADIHLFDGIDTKTGIEGLFIFKKK